VRLALKHPNNLRWHGIGGALLSYYCDRLGHNCEWIYLPLIRFRRDLQHRRSVEARTRCAKLGATNGGLIHSPRCVKEKTHAP
jgi:hypothetical protein